MLFIIRDREAGNVIEEVDTLDEAKETIAEYETIDKVEGNFTENFYEIAIKLDNNDIVSLDKFDGYYMVELVEFYQHNKKIEYDQIEEGWNRLETFNKDEAMAEVEYLLKIAGNNQGVIIHHYTNEYNKRLEEFEEDNETNIYYKNR